MLERQRLQQRDVSLVRRLESTVLHERCGVQQRIHVQRNRQLGDVPAVRWIGRSVLLVGLALRFWVDLPQLEVRAIAASIE